MDYCFEIFCFAKFYRIQCLWKIQLLDLWHYLNEKNIFIFIQIYQRDHQLWEIFILLKEIEDLGITNS